MTSQIDSASLAAETNDEKSRPKKAVRQARQRLKLDTIDGDIPVLSKASKSKSRSQSSSSSDSSGSVSSSEDEGDWFENDPNYVEETVVVTNIPDQVNGEDLQEYMEKFGDVILCWIQVIDDENFAGSVNPYAIVVFKAKKEAQAVLRESSH